MSRKECAGRVCAALRMALSVSVALVPSFVASSTLAQVSDVNKNAAEALFREARALMEEGKYAEACPKFRDSQRLDPGVGTLLNLARCYELNGQTASAWSRYGEAAAAARDAGQEGREQHAREQAARLEPTLSRIVLVVPESVALGA